MAEGGGGRGSRGIKESLHISTMYCAHSFVVASPGWLFVQPTFRVPVRQICLVNSAQALTSGAVVVAGYQVRLYSNIVYVVISRVTSKQRAA